MCGGDAILVQPARNLGEAAAARVVEADAVDDSREQRRRLSRRASLAGVARRFEVLAEEALELGDRDQPLPPRRLHRVHGRDEPAVDRRDALAERWEDVDLAAGVIPSSALRRWSSLAGYRLTSAGW